MLKEKKYIEAIVLVSAYIETLLAVFTAGIASNNSKGKGFSPDFIDDKVIANNSFDMNIKIAVCLGLIDKNLHDKVQYFKSQRNQIIHDVFGLSQKTHKHLKSIIKQGKEILVDIFYIMKEKALSNDKHS